MQISYSSSVLLLLLSLLSLSFPLLTVSQSSPGLPLVINTWGGPFTVGTDAAYTSIIDPSQSALDAVEMGCSACESHQCDGTVGYGGSPDEQCETTLDAMIMDGKTMKSGSVAALRRIKDAISVARRVLEYTTHTMLAGDQATQFAIENGFMPENLTTPSSLNQCQAWKAGNCQSNYRINVTPDPTKYCGPYRPLPLNTSSLSTSSAVTSHDTISLIAIKADGSMAAGTSTNGAGHKVPGRVGDGPITGSGSYVDEEVGGCGATGDGDIMMRFLPCYQAVESMRRGMTPQDAAVDAVKRMMRKYPQLHSGIVVVNRTGGFGAAASGWNFSFAYRGGKMNKTASVSVPPISLSEVFDDRQD